MANDDLVLEILDSSFNRIALSPNVVEATITEELGAVGDASVTLPMDDPAILFIPDPNSDQSNEGRWRLWDAGTNVFTGVVDQTTRQINDDNTYTFGGKQRGILLGTRNVGRRDFVGWPIDALFQELLRDNVGKAPIATVLSCSSQSDLHPAVSAITGDPIENVYWAAATSGSQTMVVDLGLNYTLTGLRVVPPWWDQRWYKFTIATSTDNASYTTQGTKSDNLPLGDKGEFYSLSDVSARYVRVTVSDSSDAIARLAALFIYVDMATQGADTTFLVPWIENDDSGNVTTSGTTTRPVEQGAFNGDGVIGNSLVTRLASGSSITHTFRGTSNSVYFTQGTGGGLATANIYVDGALQDSITISGSTYQYKGYEITGLASGVHTLRVERVTGTPQIDYFTGLFETSYRPIRDDDAAIGYYGVWKIAENVSYTNYVATTSKDSGSSFSYDFKGDKIVLIGTKGPAYGKLDVYIDGVLNSTVDCYNASAQYQQDIFTWSGSYTDHNIRGVLPGTKNASSTDYRIDVDGLEGNFAHVIYMRSFYENNLRLLTRLSEITNTYLRFNNDGSIDLLGAVGTTSNTIIREGENEGGSIIQAQAENDYQETCSAVLALVKGSNDNPIKAFVIDRNAVARMGLKIRKVENPDANDAYLLTRQAWQELRDHAEPIKRYSVEFDPDEVQDDVAVGETTKLYSPQLSLDGTDDLRIGRLVTTYSGD